MANREYGLWPSADLSAFWKNLGNDSSQFHDFRPAEWQKSGRDLVSRHPPRPRPQWLRAGRSGLTTIGWPLRRSRVALHPEGRNLGNWEIGDVERSANHYAKDLVRLRSGALFVHPANARPWTARRRPAANNYEECKELFADRCFWVLDATIQLAPANAGSSMLAGHDLAGEQ